MPLQAFYSIRSEWLVVERLEYDRLFCWFVGIGVDDPAWDHSVFSKDRDRLLVGDIAAKFLGAVLAQPRVKKLLSSDHFSVDGTLIEAWASMKSVKLKDSSPEVRTAYGRSLVLVRPDHYVAWAGEEAGAAKIIGMAAGYRRAAG